MSDQLDIRRGHALDLDDIGGGKPERKPGDFRRRGVDGPPYVYDPTGRTTKGGKPASVLYGRPSGFGSWIENDTGLRKWEERCMLRGLAELELTVDVDDLDGTAVKGKRAGGVYLGSERGTFVHELLDAAHRGEAPYAAEHLGIPLPLASAIVEAYHAALLSWGLEVLASEATCVDDEWRLAGSLDRIVSLRRSLIFGRTIIPAGAVCVLDLKTGKPESDYWRGYAIQIAAYAKSQRYIIDDEGEWRQEWPWPLDQRSGLILHLDLAGAIDGEAPTFRLLHVGLEAGRRAGALCCAARDWAARPAVFELLTPEPEPVKKRASRSRRAAFAEDHAPVSDIGLLLAAEEAVEGLAVDAAGNYVGPLAGEIVEVVAPLGEVVELRDDGPPLTLEVADEAPPVARFGVVDGVDVDKLDADMQALAAPPPLEVADEPPVAELRAWLQARIDVIGKLAGAPRSMLMLTWPHGVATLKRSDAHTAEELKSIEECLDAVETAHSIPFGPSRPGTPMQRVERSVLLAFPGSRITHTGGSNNG